MPARRGPRGLLFALCLLALGPSGARAGLAPGDHLRDLPFGGLGRSFTLHVPPGYDGGAPVPLVVDLHGFTSNADQQRAISGMAAVSDAEGFLVVYPNGWRNAWNGKLCCGNREVDDVGFIRAVVVAVAVEAAVDPRRVYVTGLSNGGAMSHRLACDAADLFAAAAPMAFPLADRPASGCQPSRSIPVLTVMGLTDVLVRYADGGFGTAMDTFDYWREVNACGDGVPEVLDARGQSRCQYDTGCANGVQVGLCSVTARAFPGSSFSGHILYLNPDFVLARVAWDFLSQFQLPVDAAPALESALSGEDRVTLRRGALGNARSTTRDWTVRLGQGTWAAIDENDVALTGSWRRGKGRKRSGVGALTDAAGAQLEALVADRIAGSPATSGLAFTLEPAGPVRIGVSATGRATTLRGRWRMLRDGVPGAVIGRYDLRLRQAR
jgi:polyhydroxybutyrate depolymerase